MWSSRLGVVVVAVALFALSTVQGQGPEQSDENYAIEFSDNTYRVAVGPMINLNPNTITVEFWTKIPPNAPNGKFWVSLWNDQQDQEVAVRRVENPYMNVQNAGGAIDGGAPNLKDNLWHHVAFTYDRNDVPPNNYLYLDGVEFSRTTSTGRPFYSRATLVLGHHQENHLRIDGDQRLTGQMDEVRIWSTVRTEEEIAANRDKALTGDEEGLVAYYRFDEEQGTGRTYNWATKEYDMILFDVPRVAGYPELSYEDVKASGNSTVGSSLVDFARDTPLLTGGVGAAVGLIASTLLMSKFYASREGGVRSSKIGGKGTGLSTAPSYDSSAAMTQVSSKGHSRDAAPSSNHMTQASSRSRSKSKNSSSRKRSSSKGGSRGRAHSASSKGKRSRKSKGSKDKRKSAKSSAGTEGFYRSVVSGGGGQPDLPDGVNEFYDDNRPVSGLSGSTGISAITLASSASGGTAAPGTTNGDFTLDDRGTLSPAIAAPLTLQSPDEQKANKRLSGNKMDMGTLSPAIASPLGLQSPGEQKANKRLSSGSRASSSGGKRSSKAKKRTSGASAGAESSYSIADSSGAFSDGSGMPW